MADIQKEVGILFSAKDTASPVFKGITSEAQQVVAAIKELQALGKDRTVEQEFLMGLVEGLDLVGKSATEVEKTLAALGNAEPLKKLAEGEQEATASAKEMAEAHRAIKDATHEALEAIGKLTLGVLSLHAVYEKAIEGAAAYSKSLAEVNVAIDLTGAANEELRDSIEKVASDTNKNLNQVADAFKNAYTLGAKDAKEATDAVTNSIKLAEVAGTDFKTAMNLIIPTLQGYGLGMENVEKITDELVTTSGNARLSMQQLALGIQQVAPAAKALGVSVEEVQAALITLVREGGLPARSAMRELQTILFTLQSPSKEMQARFQQIGFASAQAAIATKGLQGALKDITANIGQGADATGRLATNMRLLQGMQTLVKDSGQAYADAFEKVSDSAGAAEKAGAKLEASAEETFDHLKQAANNAFIEIGAGILPIIEPLIKALTDLLKIVADLAREYPKLTGIAGLAVAFGGLAFTVGGLVKALGGLDSIIKVLSSSTGMGKLIDLVVKLGTSAEGLSVAAGLARLGLLALSTVPILAVITALGAGIIALIKYVNDWHEANKRIEEDAKAIAALQAQLKEAGGENTQVKSLTELHNATNTQLQAYTKQLDLLQQINAKELDAAKTKDAHSAKTIQLAANELALTRAREEANAELKLRISLENTLSATFTAAEVVYKESTKAVQDYAKGLQEVQKVNLEEKTEQLKHQEETAIFLARNNIVEVSRIQKEAGEERVRLATQNAARMVEIATIEATKLKAVLAHELDKRPEDYQKVAEEVLKIDEKLRDEQIKNAQAVAKAIETARDQATKAYEGYANKVKSLEQQITAIRAKGQESDTDIDRSLLDAGQRLADARNEQEENSRKIRELIRAKDYAGAKLLADRQKDLARQIVADTKENLPKSTVPEAVVKPIPPEASESMKRFIADQNASAKAEHDAAVASEEAYNKRVAAAAQKDADAKAREDEIAVIKAQQADNQKAADQQLSNIQNLDKALDLVQQKVQQLNQQKLAVLDADDVTKANQALDELRQKAEKPINIVFVPDTSQVQAAMEKLQGGQYQIPVQAKGTQAPGQGALAPEVMDDVSRIVSGVLGETPSAAPPMTVVPEISGARGTIVGGRGERGKDSVLAYVAPGEAITKHPAVAYYGERFFKGLNDMTIPRASLGMATGLKHDLPHFAAGGLVGSSKASTQPVSLHFPFGSFELQGAVDTVGSMRLAVQAAAVKRRS